MIPATIPFAVLAEGQGFNPLDVSGIGGFLWTLVIFAVALPFMWKVVFSKVTAALTERDAKASEAIVIAQRASEEATRARAAVEARLAEANAEAQKLVGQAKERAELREREIVEHAKSEADQMLGAARAAIEVEKDKALAAIRGEVVNLSLSAATKVLGRNVGSADDRRLVEELVATPRPAGGRR